MRHTIDILMALEHEYASSQGHSNCPTISSKEECIIKDSEIAHVTLIRACKIMADKSQNCMDTRIFTLR